MKTPQGYFPPGSMLRTVHGERIVGLLYGQGALAIGALDPRNFVGTRSHTRYAERPFHRLAATGKMFEEIFYGTRAEADRVLAAVHRMHSTVKGELPQDAGRITITGDGTISTEQGQLGKLKLVRFERDQYLDELGGGQERKRIAEL